VILRTGPARTQLRLVAVAATLAVIATAAPAHAAATWTRVPSPNRGTVASALQDVAVVPGSSTAWAVGYYYDSNVAAYRTMTQRFNGTSWSIVPSLNGSATGYSQLSKVDATSSTNVWAIGYDTQAGTLVHRYNGTSWTRVSSPAGNAPRGLDVVSSTEVWVAGYSGSAATISQWKNGTWTTRYTQASVGRHLTVFEGIVSSSGITRRSLMLRRQGTSWSSLAVPPGETGSRDQLQSVAAVSSSSVWAVGYYSSPSTGLFEPLLVNWTANGGAGTLATHDVTPAIGVSAIALGVSATSAGALWTVGYTAPPSTGNRTLILRGTGG